MRQEILLGNGAIALGLVESGCQVVTSYPGTPSSEILPEVVRFVKSEKLNTYITKRLHLIRPLLLPSPGRGRHAA